MNGTPLTFIQIWLMLITMLISSWISGQILTNFCKKVWYLCVHRYFKKSFYVWIGPIRYDMFKLSNTEEIM